MDAQRKVLNESEMQESVKNAPGPIVDNEDEDEHL